MYPLNIQDIREGVVTSAPVWVVCSKLPRKAGDVGNAALADSAVNGSKKAF